jgi:NTP pyrophosphatase (non-canonical NTP hydrolase)
MSDIVQGMMFDDAILENCVEVIRGGELNKHAVGTIKQLAEYTKFDNSGRLVRVDALNLPCLDCGEIEIRLEVKNFAIEMERILRENDHKDHWKDCSSEYLVEKLREEIRELIKAINGYNRDQRTEIYTKEEINLIRYETVDVANVVMMLWDNMKNWK